MAINDFKTDGFAYLDRRISRKFIDGITLDHH